MDELVKGVIVIQSLENIMIKIIIIWMFLFEFLDNNFEIVEINISFK